MNQVKSNRGLNAVFYSFIAVHGLFEKRFLIKTRQGPKYNITFYGNPPDFDNNENKGKRDVLSAIISRLNRFPSW